MITDTWGVWGLLIASALLGVWAEKKTAWGAKVSGCLVTMVAAFLLSNLGILPVQTAVYDTVWSYLVPLAIPLLLFKSNLKRIFTETGPPLIAYLIGAVGTAVGVFVAVLLINLGPETWKVAGIFSGTYIGGSLNFVAVSQALQFHNGSLLTAAVAADNLVMALYFFVIFLIPATAFFQRRYTMRHEQGSATPVVTDFLKPRTMGFYDISMSFSLGFLIAVMGKEVAGWLGLPHAAILFITGFVVAGATLFPSFMGSLKGGEEMGMFLMQIFFAAVGATANIGTIMRQGPAILLFAAIVISFHSLIILAGGKVFRLHLDDILIASNANIGGPTTAAAMAVAKGWNELVIPAILCGTLGYAVGTYAGVILARVVRLVL